jgi:hypothetical protein
MSCGGPAGTAGGVGAGARHTDGPALDRPRQRLRNPRLARSRSTRLPALPPGSGTTPFWRVCTPRHRPRTPRISCNTKLRDGLRRTPNESGLLSACSKHAAFRHLPAHRQLGIGSGGLDSRPSDTRVIDGHPFVRTADDTPLPDGLIRGDPGVLAGRPKPRFVSSAPCPTRRLLAQQPC